MKRRPDYTGRKHYKVIKTVDDIEFRHYPENKTIRYIAAHKGEYNISRQYIPGDEEQVLQDIKNRLYDITVLKLKTPPPQLIETKTIHGKARKLTARWTVEPIEGLKADLAYIEQMMKDENQIIKNKVSPTND